MSAATLAGSMTPTCCSGILAKRFAINVAATSSRRRDRTPDIGSPVAAASGDSIIRWTNAAATVSSSNHGDLPDVFCPTMGDTDEAQFLGTANVSLAAVPAASFPSARLQRPPSVSTTSSL